MRINIDQVDPQDDEVGQILHKHLEFAHASTPEKHIYALDLEKLSDTNIRVFGARIEGRLAGIGAIRFLDKKHAELKSMHTLSQFRGQGVGKAIVEHVINFARESGIERLSLETGTSEAFGPARVLYKSLGFIECEAFGEYTLTEDNLCMTRELFQ